MVSLTDYFVWCRVNVAEVNNSIQKLCTLSEQHTCSACTRNNEALSVQDDLEKLVILSKFFPFKFFINCFFINILCNIQSVVFAAKVRATYIYIYIHIQVYTYTCINRPLIPPLLLRSDRKYYDEQMLLQIHVSFNT